MCRNVLDIYFTEQWKNFPMDDNMKGFDNCCRWLFSDRADLIFFRLRMEVPYTLVDWLSNEEKERVKQRIYERLEAGKFEEIYVVILVYWKEKKAIPLLKRYIKDFQFRNKGPFGIFACYEVKLCRDAIRMLKKAGKKSAR